MYTEEEEYEEYCLSCRNLFLYGSIPSPKEDAYKYLSQEELHNPLLRIVYVCSLRC